MHKFHIFRPCTIKRHLHWTWMLHGRKMCNCAKVVMEKFHFHNFVNDQILLLRYLNKSCSCGGKQRRVVFVIALSWKTSSMLCLCRMLTRNKKMQSSANEWPTVHVTLRLRCCKITCIICITARKWLSVYTQTDCMHAYSFVSKQQRTRL